jgi:hypothetical protein
MENGAKLYKVEIFRRRTSELENKLPVLIPVINLFSRWELFNTVSPTDPTSKTGAEGLAQLHKSISACYDIAIKTKVISA